MTLGLLGSVSIGTQGVKVFIGGHSVVGIEFGLSGLGLLGVQSSGFGVFGSGFQFGVLSWEWYVEHSGSVGMEGFSIFMV